MAREAAARAGKFILLIAVVAGALYWLSRTHATRCSVELRIDFSPLPPGVYDVEVSGPGYRTKCQFTRPGEGRELAFPSCIGDQLLSHYETMTFLGIPARPAVVKVTLARDGVLVVDHTATPQYREGHCPSAEIWLPTFVGATQ